MTKHNSEGNIPGMNRRDFVRGAGLSVGLTGLGWGQTIVPPIPDTSALKLAGKHSGLILAMYSGQHQLLYEPAASAMIANTFSMVAVGNDLKFANRLRPTPDSYDFSYGDADVAWAEQHGLLFRGHCLVWWNGLPNWFKSYVTPANAKKVMTDHITTVVKHYAGRMYSWDVVNEMIYHDNRPDGLRQKPWLELIGTDFIDIAFHTAAEADPKARLVLNECYIEHDTPAEIGRRAALLALATRLKKSGVPIHVLGVQGHLRGNTPLDKPGMTTFLQQIRDLGLEIMITEFDVDTIDVPGPVALEVTTRKYGEFLELMAPYIKVVTFEQLRDEPNIPKRADGIEVRPNLFNAQYQPGAAYSTVVSTLNRVQNLKRHA
jgi:endo-1,4-beta-xylanase